MNDDRKVRKYVRFIKKDISKGFGIPKKVLFGKEKHIKKYDKKLLKKKGEKNQS